VTWFGYEPPFPSDSLAFDELNVKPHVATGLTARVLPVMRSATHAIELGADADTSSPRAMRHLFAAHFATHPRLDDLLLCLSEVVTNAVLHGGPPIVVIGGIVDQAIRVEVSDGSTAAPVRRPTDRFQPTGRGLHLLDELTSQWGVEIMPTGKTVWFEISGPAT
jgi:anti-sigma regulatory factor (Ser/Thr protein kinase)